MKLPLYIVNAFADAPFTGNPAAVCLLDEWLSDELLQSIAAQNNLSETAFLLKTQPGTYKIRWFTPTVEVPLCGHATLASAYMLKITHEPYAETLVFESQSGSLSVSCNGEVLTMDFPSQPPKPQATPSWFVDAFGAHPVEFHQSAYGLAVFQNQSIVAELEPDFALLARTPNSRVIVTAPGEGHDFVSRFFASCDGIDEDPVTGSAHCILTPFWSNRLKKKSLTARQISRRGGEITCELRGERVLISGKAMLYASAEITL